MKNASLRLRRFLGLCLCLIVSLCLQDARANRDVGIGSSDALAGQVDAGLSSIPATPPDADKIVIAEPDIEGYADVMGAAGSVPGLSTVAVINLDTNSIMTTTATVDGAFSVNLYAPDGSSLLVKYDVDGEALSNIWQHAQYWDVEGDFSVANPLPGTIIPTGFIPPGDGTRQEYHAVSRFSELDKSWAAFHINGVVEVPSGNPPPGLAAMPGDPITMTVHLVATSPAIDCSSSMTSTLSADVSLRYLFNPEGRAEPWGMWFTANLFTPTGLPIEHEAGGEAIGIVSAQSFTLNCLSQQHAMEGNLTLVGLIPPGLPEATYRPEIRIFGTVPGEPNTPFVSVWYQDPGSVKLPSIRVGDPAPARIPWTLFGDYPVDGYRGVQAQQDIGFYDMPNRVRLPSHLKVIPRLDERSGAPLIYRLEPGSQWLSGTDRRFPCPPYIKLAYPSGDMLVEIIKPDGSVETIGPAPIRQSSVRTPTVPGGTALAEGTGQIADLYHLATMDDDFAYSFDQYGLHTIQIHGLIHDIYGNPYSLENTYEVVVAQLLDLDPAQLPTTPYAQGDFFAPGLHVYPPGPAQVEVKLTHMPDSDPSQAVQYLVSGQANRFGYFQPPPGDGIELDSPGEFRVDITAGYRTPDGTLRVGAMSWGNVVEGTGAQIRAHGRRGMDYKSLTIDVLMPPWFYNADLLPNQVGIENYYPYFSGDIHWGIDNPDAFKNGDSIHSIITIEDLTALKAYYGILRDHFPRSRNCFRWPPTVCDAAGLESRFGIGEAPLFITTASGMDPAIRPEDIDLWGYWYGSSERPDVHVREIISEDGMGTAYWRFNDTYGYQIGEPADGDQPGDIKWEFGGAVLRVPDQSIQQYAIYSSLWVLLPQDDPIGARVTAPFQDELGAGVNGGPILKLLGEDIDMLFLPKGIRPGDVLEVGDTVSFSGHVGPPLDSRVEVTITSPMGAVHSRTWHANKIGWLYDPTFDFVAAQPGRWTVDVFVEHDRAYIGTGTTPTKHNTGTVLGTAGQYSFYVVEPDSPRLPIITPQSGFLEWPGGHIEPVKIAGIAPPGTTSVHFTIHDKGIVMGQGSLAPAAGGDFSLIYDPVALHTDFSMLSLTAREGRWEGLADEVSIHFLAEGGPPLAASVTLIGEQVFVDTWHQLYLPAIPHD